jgi:hypothetical protein
VAFPDLRFDIVCEDNFRSWVVPWNDRRSLHEVTDDYVIRLFGEKLLKLPNDLRTAVFSYRVGTKGEQIDEVVAQVAETVRFRDLKGYAMHAVAIPAQLEV